MTVIKYLVDISYGAIEPHFFVAYHSIMKPISVYSFNPSTAKVVNHDGMMIVRIIIIQNNNLWAVRICGQRTNRVPRGKNMASGSGSGVYWDILFGWVLS